MTPIDTAILVAVTENVIEIWQKTGTDSQRGLEQAWLHTAYRTIDVERTYQGGWTEHTQQLMKESFPEKFVFMALITVVTSTLRSTYGIAALSLYTDWNRSKFVTAGTAEKARGWNTNLVFKDIIIPWSVVVCLTCCWTNSDITSTSRMKLNFKTVRPFKELSFKILKEAWSRLCRIIRVKFMRDAILSAGIIYIYLSFFS